MYECKVSTTPVIVSPIDYHTSQFIRSLYQYKTRPSTHYTNTKPGISPCLLLAAPVLQTESIKSGKLCRPCADPTESDSERRQLKQKKLKKRHNVAANRTEFPTTVAVKLRHYRLRVRLIRYQHHQPKIRETILSQCDSRELRWGEVPLR